MEASNGCQQLTATVTVYVGSMDLSNVEASAGPVWADGETANSVFTLLNETRTLRWQFTAHA